MNTANERMTKALETLGFTQEQIFGICSGALVPQIVSDEGIRAFAAGLFGGDGSIESCKNLYAGSDEFGVCEAYEYWPLEDIQQEAEGIYEGVKRLMAPTLVSNLDVVVKAESSDEIKTIYLF